MSANLYNGTTGQLEPFAGRESDDRFVGTQAQWNALTTQEKAAYIGKDVIITDDEEVVVASITADGVKTLQQILASLKSAVGTFDSEKEYKLVNTSNLGNKFYFRQTNYYNGDVKFNQEDTYYNAFYSTYYNVSDSGDAYRLKVEASGNTFQNQNSNVPSAGSKYEIIQIS